MRFTFVIPHLWHEPLGIMSLSAVLKAGGHQVSLCCGSTQNILEKIGRIAPDVVGISSYTGGHQKDITLAREIKRSIPTTIIFGGPHPTFFPEIIRDEGVDVVCRGEGEISLPAFLNVFGTPGACQIPGIWVKQDGIIHQNGMPTLVDELDKLPDFDRSLIYQASSHLMNSQTKFFLTGRGCPYSCAYCYNQPLHKLYQDTGSYVRQRSVEKVIDEIKKVRSDYPLGIVYFLDDTFGFQARWLEEFCTRYKVEIGLPFICQVRPNFLTAETTHMLAKAGCRMVSLGIETGSPHKRQELLQRAITNEVIINACNRLHANGIKVFTLNMLGLPGEDLSEAFKTLDFNLGCKPDYAWASIYQPYPGTSLGQKACDLGLFDGNPDNIPSSLYERSALNFTPPEMGVKLLRLQRLFALTVHFSWLRPFIPLLTHIPIDKLYTALWRWFQDHAYSSIMDSHT
jgi:anaerobic magnesium-protoporphyrin IX monomethyl ester cyclase